MPRKRLTHTEYIVRLRTAHIHNRMSKSVDEGFRKAINRAARKALKGYIRAGKLDHTFTADTR